MTRLGFWALAALGLSACGDTGPTHGVVEGVITLAYDSLPEPTRIRNTTDPEACGPEHVVRDLVVSPTTQGLMNVVVTVAGESPAGEASDAPARIIIDNRGCQFLPHVVVAQVGDTVVAQNSDTVPHTTHYHGPLNFNAGLPTLGSTDARVLQRAGVIIVLCDLHGWMRAYVRVDQHRLHAVSDEVGRVRIKGVPTGSHVLELWHERLGEQQIRVDVKAGETTRFEVSYALSLDRR